MDFFTRVDANFEMLHYYWLEDLISIAALCKEAHGAMLQCHSCQWGYAFGLPSEMSPEVFQALYRKVKLSDAIRVGVFAHKHQQTSISDTLRLAAALDKHALVRILLSAGVDPNSAGSHTCRHCYLPALPLHAAAKFGRAASMSCLLASSAEADAVSPIGSVCAGWTAMTWALSNDQFHAMELLLTFGASPQSTIDYVIDSGRDTQVLAHSEKRS